MGVNKTCSRYSPRGRILVALLVALLTRELYRLERLYDNVK